MTQRLTRIVLFAVMLSIAAAQPAHAYVDPNAGGMLFQLLAVAFATMSGMVLFFSRHIKRTFARMRRLLREREVSRDV